MKESWNKQKMEYIKQITKFNVAKTEKKKS
jgi:hypothetical protein